MPTKKRKTATSYSSHPDARKKKNEYQKRYNKRPDQVKKRVELNKINRQKGTYGNNDKKDVSHLKGGGTTMEKQSTNRARNRSKK